jgi:hypothetical protein
MPKDSEGVVLPGHYDAPPALPLMTAVAEHVVGHGAPGRSAIRGTSVIPPPGTVGSTASRSC